jgi:hypothetical protein
VKGQFVRGNGDDFLRNVSENEELSEQMRDRAGYLRVLIDEICLDAFEDVGEDLFESGSDCDVREVDPELESRLFFLD